MSSSSRRAAPSPPAARHTRRYPGRREPVGRQRQRRSGAERQAARDVHLAGLVEKDKSTERGYQRNHTSSLRTGSWSSSDSESLKASELRSQGELTLKAGRNVTTRAPRSTPSAI
ncbi:hypothetical protein M8494_29505 [Serratia ureilytica]